MSRLIMERKIMNYVRDVPWLAISSFEMIFSV